MIGGGARGHRPAGLRRPVPAAGAADAATSALRAVRRPEGSGAHPARQPHPGRRRSRRRAPVRHRRGRRRLLRAGPGQPGAHRGAPAAAADAHGAAAAVGARRPAGRRARGRAPPHRRPTARPPTGSASTSCATLPEDAWISFVVRDQRLLPVRGDSELRAGDEVLVIADPGSTTRSRPPSTAPPERSSAPLRTVR